MSRMDLKVALTILIQAASRDIQGTGVGIRPAHNEDVAEKVKRAVRRVFPLVYGHEMGGNDEFNLF